MSLYALSRKLRLLTSSCKTMKFLSNFRMRTELWIARLALNQRNNLILPTEKFFSDISPRNPYPVFSVSRMNRIRNSLSPDSLHENLNLFIIHKMSNHMHALGVFLYFSSDPVFISCYDERFGEPISNWIGKALYYLSSMPRLRWRSIWPGRASDAV